MSVPQSSTEGHPHTYRLHELVAVHTQTHTKSTGLSGGDFFRQYFGGPLLLLPCSPGV